jgi:Uma2 family endonuclease
MHHATRIQKFAIQRRTLDCLESAHLSKRAPAQRSRACLPFTRQRAYAESMRTAESVDQITVEDYLAGESHSEVRHEYAGGLVYAMAGASEEHNIIGLNLATSLHAHVGDGPCRVFMADMKLRLSVAHDEVFYYPDLLVTCDSRDTDRYAMRYPKVIIEVLSSETERTDRREKFFSYTSVETLDEYVLVAQSRREVTVFRRSNQWMPEVLTNAEQTLELRSLEFATPLSAIYRRVKVSG